MLKLLQGPNLLTLSSACPHSLHPLSLLFNLLRGPSASSTSASFAIPPLNVPLSSQSEAPATQQTIRVIILTPVLWTNLFHHPAWGQTTLQLTLTVCICHSLSGCGKHLKLKSEISIRAQPQPDCSCYLGRSACRAAGLQSLAGKCCGSKHSVGAGGTTETARDKWWLSFGVSSCCFCAELMGRMIHPSDRAFRGSGVIRSVESNVWWRVSQSLLAGLRLRWLLLFNEYFLCAVTICHHILEFLQVNTDLFVWLGVQQSSDSVWRVNKSSALAFAKKKKKKICV